MSKISELSDGGALQSTDYLIAVRSGGNVKVQLSELPSGIGAGGNIVFGDNEKAIFGAGSDLQIYHDGSHSYVSDQGTGNLRIYANDLVLANNDGSETFLYGVNGGAVSISYANNAKLATTSTGIDVTGTVTADGLTVNGSIGNFAISTGGNQATFDYNGFNYINSTGAGSALVVRMGSTSANAIRFDSDGKVIVNDDGNDTDFRVESDANTHMLFVDAGNDRVAVGTSDTATHTVETGVDATMRVSNGLKVARALTASGNDRDVLMLDTPGSWSTTGNITTQTYLSWGNGGDNIMGRVGLRFGGSTITGGQSEISIKDLYENGYGASGTVATFGSNNFTVFQGGATVNEGSYDQDFRVESDSNTHMLFVDASADVVNIGSTAGAQTGSLLHVRRNASCIEWGHGNNSAGYFGTLGAYGNNGHPYIGWSTEADTVNVDSFGTYGAAGSIIKGDLSGNLIFAQVPLANATGQTPVERLTVAPTEFIVNDASNNYDFRVESDNNTHALFVDANLNVTFIGKSSSAISATGFYFSANTGNAEFTGDGSTHPFRINRLNNDGTLIQFLQDNSPEGDISVSGSTVSYNGFAGRHESSGIATTTAKGTVVSTIDELDEYLSGPRQGQTRADHAKVEVSSSVGDPCVYGVVDNYTEDGSVNVISVGIGAVLVTGACAKGDLLESNGDGTARVQDDDIVRSKTIGKVTIGNSNTGVKLVSCVLYCG